MPAEPRIETEPLAGNAWLVRLNGEIDLHSAPELDRDLLLATRTGNENIVVDLSGASHIDSSTLAVLNAARKRLACRGGVVHLVCADPNVVRLLELTAFDRVFVLHTRLGDALERVSNLGALAAARAGGDT